MYQVKIFLKNSTIRCKAQTPEQTLHDASMIAGIPFTYRPADGEVFIPGSAYSCGVIFKANIHGN